MVPDQTDRRKAPSSGLLGLSARSAASAATPLRAVLRVRGQRPLPAGPSLPGWVPLFPKTKVLLNFFQKIAGSRGRAPDALRTASRSEAFRAQPAEGKLLARDERGTHSPVKLRSGLRADALRRLAYARRCGGQSKVAGSRGRAPAAARTRRNVLSWGKRFFGVNTPGHNPVAA